MGSTYIDRGLLGSRIVDVNFSSGTGRIWWMKDNATIVSELLNGPANGSPVEHTVAASLPSGVNSIETNSEGDLISLYHLNYPPTYTRALVRLHPSFVGYPLPDGLPDSRYLNRQAEQNPHGSIVHGAWKVNSGTYPVQLVQYDANSGVELEVVGYVATLTSPPTQNVVPYGIVTHGDELFFLWHDFLVSAFPDFTFALKLDRYSRTTPLVLLDRITVDQQIFGHTPYGGSSLSIGKSGESPAGPRLNVRVLDSVSATDYMKTYTTDLVETPDTQTTPLRPNLVSYDKGLTPLPDSVEVSGTRWYWYDGAGPFELHAENGTANMREWDYVPGDLGAFGYTITGF